MYWHQNKTKFEILCTILIWWDLAKLRTCKQTYIYKCKAEAQSIWGIQGQKINCAQYTKSMGEKHAMAKACE